MQKKSIVIIGSLLVFIIVIGWWVFSPQLFDRTVDEELPPIALDTNEEEDNEKTELMAEEMEATTPDIQEEEIANEFRSLSGVFMDGVRNYKTSGNVKSIRADDGLYLRFEDFQTTNGPDLFVYLIQQGMRTRDGINLGALKGNTGNQNYLVPTEVDISQHHIVVIWCRAFDADFGTAELMP
jgi:hypothetical protein